MNDRTSAPEPGAVALETGPTPLPRRIGPSDLHVFPLALSGTVFGWTADESASFAVLDAFVEAGGTAIDTADAYSMWVDGHTGGESERIIGAWLSARPGMRERVSIATKVFAKPDRPGLAPANAREQPQFFVVANRARRQAGGRTGLADAEDAALRSLGGGRLGRGHGGRSGPGGLKWEMGDGRNTS